MTTFFRWKKAAALLATSLIAQASLPAADQSQGSKANSKPNIIVILADDMGYECVGANGGGSYQTPSLDKMAQQGAVLRHERGPFGKKPTCHADSGS